MDFIERIFGASPDGGSGSLELLYLALSLLTATAGYWALRARSHGRRAEG
jgi:hypothetical protein